MALPLPSKVVGTYFTLWGGGMRITSVPLDYNLIYLFHATPAGGGAFRFDYGGSVSPAEIDTCQARGQRVVLTVGGANAGYNFQNRTESTNFVNSFKQMYTALGGVDGCDFNNFEAGIGSNATEMTWISQQLKAAYGQDFSITCPPHPGAGWAPMDRTLTKAMGAAGVLDYAGPQFYDSADLTQQALIVSLIDEWVAHLGDARKVVVGLSSNYGGGPTLATSQGAWRQIVAKHPTIRGVFAWSAQDDAGGGWNFGKTMGPLVKAGSTTPAPAPAPSPAPAPAPATGTAETWVAGKMYRLGAIVLYQPNGRYYKLGQVDATGTSNGTDPTISTWYWQPTTAPAAPAPAPAPAPTGLRVGDTVSITGTTRTGKILSISGTNAMVQVDGGVQYALTNLVKK